MADENDGQEKTEEPSQYRMEEFRRKGQVALSRELSSVLALAATLFALFMSVLYIYETLSDYIHWVYTIDFKVAFHKNVFATILKRSLYTIFQCVFPIFVSSLCVGVLANLMQIGFIYAPEVLSIKLERINPLSGLKKLLSMRSVVEAVKGVFKFIVIISISYSFLKDDVHHLIGFLHLEGAEFLMQTRFMLARIAFSILGGLLVVAGGDFAWQRYSYSKQLKMTKQEARDELKEKEGNPEIKQRIKSIQREVAQKRMMGNVKDADAIITNPTHISIAIKYDKEKMIAPEVIAKGADHVALQIRTLAKKFDIPVVENVPLARTLYATVKVGSGVPRTLYKAVAEILAYVYRVKKKKQALEVRE